jgi:hypothetical protein
MSTENTENIHIDEDTLNPIFEFTPTYTPEKNLENIFESGYPIDDNKDVINPDLIRNNTYNDKEELNKPEDKSKLVTVIGGQGIFGTVVKGDIKTMHGGVTYEKK